MIITIDGPAGTGKTTVAKRVAENLGFLFFDTGALYRAVAYGLIKKKIDSQDTSSLEAFLNNFHFEIRPEKDNKKYFMDGEDVTEKIRTPEISRQASEVSTLAPVRQALLVIQREFGKGKNVVFEGRDMGTIVFPKADLKIFLTARPPVRVERRYKEFKEKSQGASEADVMRELLERDQRDSTRELSPLIQAEDAHLIDTSDLTIDDVVLLILKLMPR